MTPKEIEEIKALAGLGEKSETQKQKEWADKQLTNQPTIENKAPIPTFNDFVLTKIKNTNPEDRELENLANKLNTTLGTNILSDIKIERLS